MEAITHLEKVIVGEVSAVTHLEKVIAGETSAVTYTEKVITGEAPPITHLQKVIAGEASPVTHLEYVWVGGTPSPTEHEYTGAVPYTFTANGSPLISWRISGNTVQNGTPTPDSPIMPEGTGERTGNLFDKTDILSGYEIVNNQIVPNSAWGVSDYIPVEQGKYYIATNTGAPVLEYETIGGIAVRSGISIVGGNYTPSATTRFIRINFKLVNLDDIMLNTGSTALPYEPFGVKIPISSANTTTNVYLGEVETTRRIRKLVLTGEEQWVKSGAYQGSFYAQTVTGILSETYTAFCSHLTFSSLSQYAKGKFCFNGGITKNCNLWFNQFDSSTTVADFKSYLQQQYAAGTPVTVWYVLATEETGIVNEPLMKIGDYADEVSNVATIPTVNGSNTFDVDTTLKPSEVYIKYKGV